MTKRSLEIPPKYLETQKYNSQQPTGQRRNQQEIGKYPVLNDNENIMYHSEGNL